MFEELVAGAHLAVDDRKNKPMKAAIANPSKTVFMFIFLAFLRSDDILLCLDMKYEVDISLNVYLFNKIKLSDDLTRTFAFKQQRKTANVSSSFDNIELSVSSDSKSLFFHCKTIVNRNLATTD